jgi:putative Holliday junction resolvase
MTAKISPGVRLGVDVGTVRVGVAACDPTATLVSPVETLRRDKRGQTDMRRLADIVHERGAVEIVVGLPQTLRASDSASTQDARDYAASLARHVDVPVRLADERLTTVTAAARLQSAGHDSRAARGRIDAAAAVVLLESALDQERRTGEPSGELVTA